MSGGNFASRPSPKERRAKGRELRRKVPLESHADWSPGLNRTDPVELIESQNLDRIDWLVPVRRKRMSVSPFTFFRGAARIMAHDLAGSPVSGLRTQICGDAHLANFGGYASPERRLVFDLNDFDETLPGPWEWDVKRLATSLFISSRFNGLSKKTARLVTKQCLTTYRQAMLEFAEMRTTDIWYRMLEFDEIRQAVKGAHVRKVAGKVIERAMRKTSRHVLDKLAEEVDGRYQIRNDPPFLIPVRCLPEPRRGDRFREQVLSVLDDYRETLPDHIQVLFDKFEPIDVAVKVVGVGSVGTRCFIVLMQGRDQEDPLFLQIKEAGPSVLEECLPKSQYETSGQRVVEGQRLMQTVSDVFLGWTIGQDSHYYVRQLKDWKTSIDVEDAGEDEHYVFARLRGATLARAHARSGDPIAIAGYLGETSAFDDAVTVFSELYSSQNQADYDAFKCEIDEGRLEASDHL